MTSSNTSSGSTSSGVGAPNSIGGKARLTLAAALLLIPMDELLSCIMVHGDASTAGGKQLSCIGMASMAWRSGSNRRAGAAYLRRAGSAAPAAPRRAGGATAMRRCPASGRGFCGGRSGDGLAAAGGEAKSGARQRRIG